MRYADFAAKHIQENEDDPARAALLDQRAKDAGFENVADYIDNIQGKEDTRSFEGSNGRTCWVNEGDRIYGWNNQSEPENSTVIPARKSVSEFENHKKEEERVLGKEIPEHGPLTEEERIVDPTQIKQDEAQEPEKIQVQEVTETVQQNQPDPEKEPEQKDAEELLLHVDLPAYAAAEHGYSVEALGADKFILEKDGEELRVEHAKDGTWSYENQDNDEDRGDIVDFATRRGDDEASINEYLDRNPEEREKAEESLEAAENAPEITMENSMAHDPGGRDM